MEKTWAWSILQHSKYPQNKTGIMNLKNGSLLLPRVNTVVINAWLQSKLQKLPA
jgi:hypothetical protein